MSTMYGANVEQLRQCAQQFDQQARAVDSMARWLQQIPLDGWKGPDARQFHDEVQHTLVPHLTRVAVAVREAARDLRTQAQQQEHASAAGGRAAPGTAARGTGRGALAGSVSSSDHLANLVGVLRAVVTDGGNAGTLGDLAELSDLARLPKFFGPVGDVLGVGSAAFAGVDIAEGIADHDTGKVVGGIVDISLAVAGKTPLAPVAWGVGLGKALVDASIPYTSESQDSLLDYEAEQLFHTPRSELTPAQASALANRYTGAGGVVNMISDKMNQTAEPIDAAGRWFWHAVGAR